MDRKADTGDCVEVKIKGNGLDLIEVIDNGAGVSEADWQSVGGYG
jgi:DNA mismatch repair ATPase MutL